MSEKDNPKVEQLRNSRLLRREAGADSASGMSAYLLELLVARERTMDEIVEGGGFRNASDFLIQSYENQIGIIAEYKATHGIEEPPLPIEE